MCIISNSRRFCFVHVPKCAGTSITAALSQYSTWRDVELGATEFGEHVAPAYRKRFRLYKHIPASELKVVVGSEIWASYFTFSFVRNPYSRAESLFHHLRQWRIWSGSEIMDSLQTLPDFIASDFFLNHDGPDNVFRPQANWICDPGGEVLVDYVGRFETLREDFSHVLRCIGLEAEGASDAPHTNKSERRSLDVWTPATRAVIQKRWARDFTVFGYSPGDAHPEPFRLSGDGAATLRPE